MKSGSRRRAAFHISGAPFTSIDHQAATSGTSWFSLKRHRCHCATHDEGPRVALCALQNATPAPWCNRVRGKESWPRLVIIISLIDLLFRPTRFAAFPTSGHAGRLSWHEGVPATVAGSQEPAPPPQSSRRISAGHSRREASTCSRRSTASPLKARAAPRRVRTRRPPPGGSGHSQERPRPSPTASRRAAWPGRAPPPLSPARA